MDADFAAIKDEYAKIGVNSIFPFTRSGKWFFKHEGQLFSLAPAEIMNMVLSPLTVGVDKIMNLVCEKKGISGCVLLFSEQYFPNADMKFVLAEQKSDGWIYNIEELNLKGLLQGYSAWVCPYLLKFHKEPPKCLYLRLDSLDKGIK